MSFSVASYFTRSPRASSASVTSASSPIEGALLSCRCASLLSTQFRRKPNRNPRPHQPAPMALSQVRWTDGRCRTIHGSTTPTSFSTGPSHGCMKSLAHTPYCPRPSERLAEVRLRYTQRSSSCPRLTSLRPSTPVRTGAPPSPLPALTSPANFYNPRSLHSICISSASAAPAASF